MKEFKSLNYIFLNLLSQIVTQLGLMTICGTESPKKSQKHKRHMDKH